MISLNGISKTYGGNVALAPTTIKFAGAKTTALLGPSGCGKSTLLRIILGLVRPDSGTAAVDGEAVTPDSAMRVRRKVGYVIQDGGLFPHLTAADNLALLPRFLKVPIGEIESRQNELCQLARLAPDLLPRFPAELSGGQRQRVGLMRALMLDPPTLLLDEPLGALDPITRNELQDELKAIFARLAKTVVLVTHDLTEAAYLADTIVLMRDGHVVQAGSADDLRERPTDPYVTEFLRAQRGLDATGSAST